MFVLSSFSSFLPNSRVKWFTDSQGAGRIVQVGSMNFNLHKLASDIFSFCLELIWTLSGSLDPLMKKRIISAKLLIMMTGSLSPSFFGNSTSSGGRLWLIALPLAITGRSLNIFHDSGILGQPELTRFSRTGNTKIA